MNVVSNSKKRFFARYARPGLYALLALAVAVNVTDPLLGQAREYVESFFVSPYQLYLAELEHDHLEKVNERMMREIVALRTRQTSTRKIELELVEKIDLVEKAIEEATHLDLFESRNKQIKKNVSGKLAAILESEELRKIVASNDTSGIGGAEGLCEDDCVEHIGLSPVVDAKQANSDPVVVSMAVAHERAERFVDVLRTLPIGAPVSARVSSGYGYRRSPFSRKRTFHYGLDLALPTGNPVRATGGGTVVKSMYTRTYGYFVDIEHSAGLVTRYAHLRKLMVKKGDVLARGDVLGLCGSTGRSTGPHVHYEVRYKGRTRNPAPFVALADTLSQILAVSEQSA